MAYFAVSYQLNNEKNYAPLWDALDDMGGHKVMNSFYFLDLDGTCFTRALAGTNDWIEARF